MTAGHFDLYTTANEDAGRQLVLRLEELESLLQPMLNWRGQPRDKRERPVCIIAFGSRDEFLPYAPIGRSVGFFLAGARRDFMVLDGASAENRAAAHEFVHLVLSRGGYRLPPWLNEGLAELYSNLLQQSRSGPRAVVGRLIPERVLALDRGRWIALADLTSADAQAEVFTTPALVDAAYSESWLLAHMLVLDAGYADQFPALVAAIQSADAAEAFRQVYGKSLAQVECDLKTYLEVAGHNVRTLGDPPPRNATSIDTYRFADFDARLALAEMLGSYRGRTEESRDMYRQLEIDYPRRFPE